MLSSSSLLQNKLDRAAADCFPDGNFSLIMTAPSVNDPWSNDRLFVSCKKHKQFMRVEHDIVPTTENILKASQQCPICIKEFSQHIPATRWGEDAEL